MWPALFQPGLALLDGRTDALVVTGQLLAHHAIHHTEGTVLWCDGSHNFNPYDLAELNLIQGHEADDGAERVLVKRCMTPFQWDTVLTKHLGEKLDEVDASLALAIPFDRLFSTDELKDWEQVDYVTYALEHLEGLAHEHQVPLVLCADLDRWQRTHAPLARLTDAAVERRWRTRRGADGWPRIVEVEGPLVGRVRAQTTLLDFLDEAVEA